MLLFKITKFKQKITVIFEAKQYFWNCKIEIIIKQDHCENKLQTKQ